MAQFSWRAGALAVLALFSAAAAGVAAPASVALTAEPADGGTVSGSGTYEAGKLVTIKAKPAKVGWLFDHWSDGTNTPTRKVLVPTNGVSLTAHFAIRTGTLAISPGTLDLGRIPLSSSSSQAVALVNSGPGALTIKKLSVSKPFTVAPAKGVIPAGATQVVYVGCQPKAVGTNTGSLTVSSDAARLPAPVGLSAVCIPATRLPRLEGDLAFGSVWIGQEGVRPLTVWNDGNTPLVVTGLTWTNNPNNTFRAAPAAFTVAAGSSVVVQVTFAPATTAVWQAALVLTAPAMTGGTRGVAVSGMGDTFSPGTRILRLAGDLHFGEQLAEQTVSRPLTVYNDGTATAQVFAVSWTNNAEGVFRVEPSRFRVAPGTATVVNVLFAPRAPRLFTNAALVLHASCQTGGTNGIALSGGASAWVQGTWKATFTQGGSLAGKGYVWQEGTSVVAVVKAADRVDGVFVGTVQDRTNIPGVFWNFNVYQGATSLTYATGPVVLGGFLYNNKPATVKFANRSSTNRPSIAMPTNTLPQSVARLSGLALRWQVASLAPPALRVTLLETAGGAPLACAPDGRCAVVQMVDGRAAALFPADLAPPDGWPVVVLQAEGDDDNDNGVPDLLERVLGIPLADGMELGSLLRDAGGLRLETPFVEQWQVEGAATLPDRLPATWRIRAGTGKE